MQIWGTRGNESSLGKGNWDKLKGWRRYEPKEERRERLQENKQEESVSVAPGPAERRFVSYKNIRVIFFPLLLANNDKEECLQSLVKWNSPQGYSN